MFDVTISKRLYKIFTQYFFSILWLVYEVCCVECCNKLKTFPPPSGRRPVCLISDLGGEADTGLPNINDVF